jgi:hypothetical protein
MSENAYELSWFDRLFLSQEDINRGVSADAQLKRLNAENRDRGIITDAQLDDMNDRIDSTSLPGMLSDPSTSTYGGFKEGLAEGASNIRNAAGEVINSTIGTGFRLIPWQAYVIGGLFLGGWIWINFFRKRA